MTAVPIRNTQFATWIDEDAWMESMKGSKWEELLDQEEKIVKKVIKREEVQKRLGLFKVYYEAVSEDLNPTRFYTGAICVTWHGAFFRVWNWLGSTVKHEARDVISNFTHVWSIQDVGKGAEDFQLQCWSSACSKVADWKKSHVGPDVGLLGQRIFYLKARNKLQYYQLWSCDATTGKDETLHYTEHNPEVNCSLERHADGALLFACENSQDFVYYQVQPNGSLKKQKEKYPILHHWILPLKEYGIDFVWPSKGLLITKQHGEKTLWYCTEKHSPRKIHQIPAGDIFLDPYAVWSGTLPCIVRVEEPDSGIKFYKLEDYHLTILSRNQPTGLVSTRISAKSKDQKTVHGIITVSTSEEPTNLLVIGYGAYGMPTSVGSVAKRWAPLVKRGWAILHTFLRGGGDHTEKWAKTGRLDGRKHTVNDFIALIKDAQLGLGIKPSNTVIYGRSAGGLLVGEAIKQYPNGKLFKGIYTEVPYVDELRTTTNKQLPLTTLEHNEFGNPTVRLSDFLHVGLTSPADSASVIETPAIFILARTSLNDSQVYAYEPLKWIRRLRANAPYGEPKLCIVERDQGHFTPPEKVIDQWALDCAILDALISD